MFSANSFNLSLVDVFGYYKFVNDTLLLFEKHASIISSENEPWVAFSNQFSCQKIPSYLYLDFSGM